MAKSKSSKPPGQNDVGYGKPPVKDQFKPGQSGNPAGRRKGQPTLNEMVMKEAARLVKIKRGDTVETITKYEGVIRRTFQSATSVASQLGIIFPTDIALAFLRDSNPSVRALTCACVRAGYEVVATLIAMLDDPDGEVSAAAACALGRMGRVEARIHLKRYLTERPSGRVVEAVARVADDEAIVLLARVGRARPDLAHSIISALEEIDSTRAVSAALGLKRFVSKEERR